MNQPRYMIRRTAMPSELRGNWDGEIWRQAEVLEISCFRPEGSNHRPDTRVKLLYDNDRIYLIFRVLDRYVRCVHTEYLDPVYLDSCVEWFVQPREELGYFNIEINCGGAMLCYYIEDATRHEDRRLAKFQPIPTATARQIAIYHSLPAVIEPELAEPQDWYVEYAVPYTFFDSFLGPIRPVAGQTWRANFYKCGNATSHPHWASWSPIGERDFHRPRDFAPIVFGES